ncbi:MAG: L,D-transpeptidase family protein [Rhodospirillales bacterium]|nr:L,D-transpeptidase family protein [Rhodospirillales bacterium]
MDITVSASGGLAWPDCSARCAIGRSGLRAAKQEGDGATPIGRFALRRVLFRSDRLAAPETALPCAVIDPDLGWCDDPSDAAYNKAVRLPYPARHERMWREDALYDLLAIIGYNDEPVVPARGSAIFLHVARPDFGPTEGCIALALDPLRALLRVCAPGDHVCIGA